LAAASIRRTESFFLAGVRPLCIRSLGSSSLHWFSLDSWVRFETRYDFFLDVTLQEAFDLSKQLFFVDTNQGDSVPI